MLSIYKILEFINSKTICLIQVNTELMWSLCSIKKYVHILNNWPSSGASFECMCSKCQHHIEVSTTDRMLNIGVLFSSSRYAASSAGRELSEGVMVFHASLLLRSFINNQSVRIHAHYTDGRPLSSAKHDRHSTETQTNPTTLRHSNGVSLAWRASG